jgi:hypothetical protein
MASWISFRPETTNRHSPSRTHQRKYRASFQRDLVEKPAKRRQETLDEVKWVEPCLIGLCREKRWHEVVRRCQSHPEEAVPRLVSQACNRYDLHSVKRIVKSNLQATSTEEPIFQETPLGIACASTEIQSAHVQAAIEALVRVNPSQLSKSQLIPGHTPLRDALKNPRLTPNILNILSGSTDSTKKGGSNFQSALRKTDRNGLLPLDHLIISVQLGAHPQSLDLLKEIVRSSDIIPQESTCCTSPLIRLLSMGTSFGSIGTDYESPSSVLSGETGYARLEHILDATKYLLEQDPSLINLCSRITGCSPLHVALRNYGDYAPLIRELVSRDPSGIILTLRNHYGDLPLHVACSVGVPIAVLRLILEYTLTASRQDSEDPGRSPNPLVWSVNNSGYTPIDLEWVRHIESGKSFYSARSFYPLEPTGVRKHCFKQDEYYQDLLREVVDQLVQPSLKSLKDPLLVREEEAKSTFGVLIDRIMLIISSAATKSMPTDPKAFLLHNACKLCCPAGPNLPLPLLELIIWMHPEQLVQQDPSRNLPIHYAMRQSKIDCKTSTLQNWTVWELLVLRLLAEAPETARLPDAEFRLPLHHLLTNSKNGSAKNEIHDSRQKIVKKLLQLHPESVDVQDPATMLYPFMLAATDPENPIELVFFLLRHSPSRCYKCQDSTVTHTHNA